MYRMRYLFENEYPYNKPPSPAKRTASSDVAIIKSKTMSILDGDFENDEENETDEIATYITEKPVSKETDVLMWWKVRLQHLLTAGFISKI